MILYEKYFYKIKMDDIMTDGLTNSLTNNLTDVVSRYINLGWVIMPIKHDSKIPLNQKWTAITIDMVRGGFSGCGSDINFGVVCGEKSGIFVIDVDVKSGGIETMNNIFIKYGNFNTVYSRTASGGNHYFFKYESRLDIFKSRSGVLPGVDIRSNGSQAVIPPSKIKGSGSYVWINSPFQNGCEFGVLPDWMFKILSETAGVYKPRIQKSLKGTNGGSNDDTITNEYYGKSMDEIINIKLENTEFLKKMIPEYSVQRATEYDLWINVIWGAKGHSYPENALLDTVKIFSKKCIKYNEADVEKFYRLSESYGSTTTKMIGMASMSFFYYEDTGQQSEYYMRNNRIGRKRGYGSVGGGVGMWGGGVAVGGNNNNNMEDNNNMGEVQFDKESIRQRRISICQKRYDAMLNTV